ILAYSAGYGVSYQNSSSQTGVLQKDLAQCYDLEASHLQRNLILQTKVSLQEANLELRQQNFEAAALHLELAEIAIGSVERERSEPHSLHEVRRNVAGLRASLSSPGELRQAL
ncbi:MAG: hypothetical protein HN348_02335, partial [Proteobacteria bacterium]|nr:hypothetical protein [Pseudomonadota bacterium]